MSFENEVEVWTAPPEPERQSVRVGSLRASRSARTGGETYSFEYHDLWLERADAFRIDPALPLAPGGLPTRTLPGCFQDSAPDRWGQTLISAQERRAASQEDRPPRRLTQFDVLLRVADVARPGALRIREPSGVFLAEVGDAAVPPLVDLRTLMAAARGFIQDPSNEDLLRILLAPGSSMGGARPKAVVRDDKGTLFIAKFPKPDDAWSVERWEHVTLRLARAAGIRCSASELVEVDEKPVILIRRFDRGPAGTRYGLLSANSLLQAQEAQEGEDLSYLELAQALRMFSSDPIGDLRELWRRIVFGLLVSNRDDHMRNHAMLRTLDGLRLSPAFDINPDPDGGRDPLFKTALTDDEGTRVQLFGDALDVATYFDLDSDQATAIAREVAESVVRWPEVARKAGAPDGEIRRMKTAFREDQIDEALAL